MRQPTSRRHFLAQAAASAALLAAPRARAEAPATPPRYIDMHTHLGQAWGARPALSAQALLRWMDEHAIGQAVVMPLVSPESFDYPISTHYVLEETAAYRDRLLPFCCLDPRVAELNNEAARARQLEKYVEAGARGFGEYKVGLPIDDPRSIALFKSVAAFKLPILFHLDNVRNTDAPGLPGLARVLDAVPEGVFIGHGPGWWASISGDLTPDGLGGYPSGPVAPGGALDALMDRFPNIHGELSAGSGANAIARDIEFGREFLIRRADRLLFGTDFLAPGQPVPQLSLYLEINLPSDVEEKIYRSNARTLLRLSQ